MQSSSSTSSRSARSPSAQQHFHSGSSGSSVDTAMTSQSSAPRSSSSSTRSQSSRSGVPNGQISQIEKSVTHLLVATKQLLETLTQWSRRQVSESEVSDVYVRLGYEFNLACRAFNAIGVDTSDLGPVPDLLRTILEDTLSQDASPQSLDLFLPRIRDIIINLLHGLKRKQARLRSRQQREEGRAVPNRQASAGSVTSSVVNQTYEETLSVATSPKRPSRARYDSSGSLEDQPQSGSRSSPEARSGSFSEREASRREAQNALTQSAQDSETSSKGSVKISEYPPPPPPPPKQDDAIGALQRSGELERRASRRFSAYQIQKHLGASSNGVPVIPTQNSPLPNRGRDVRESLNAVRLRGSYAHGRQRSTNRSHGAIDAKATQQQQPSSGPAPNEDPVKPRVETRAEPSTNGTPSTDTESKRPAKDVLNHATDQPPVLPPTLQEPFLADAFDPVKEPGSRTDQGPVTPKSSNRPVTATTPTPPQSTQFSPEQPSPGKELTLFLQYRSKIKKFILPEGPTGLTIGRLQLAFIEKFAWNTHNNGVDLPEIYIQDPVSGVRHELEDLSDVKDRSVLVLNVDALDEVKKHFDDEFGGVRRLLESVKGALDGQESMMHRVSDRQLEAAKEIARLAAAPSVSTPSPPVAGETQRVPISGSASQLAELSSLRRDLAVLRQTYSNFSADIASSMSAIRSKAESVKTSATDASVPSFEGDAGRARVNSGKKELAEESERLVARVDDLQDLIEDLRKDVVTRGVRPLPRQLETVGKDISAATKEIKKMKDFLKREKPVWTKIWEKELQLVCEERDQLTMQEDLAADLEDDLEKAAQTFALVEQATKQQSLHNTNGTPTLRNTSRNVVIDPAVDPMKAKDSVLGEVRALQPNHESRLEAIERAEKARQKELETRRGDLFQKELGKFVKEGKLKKSGGFEEAERLRRAKDERIRKDIWEKAQARAAEIDKAEAEASSNAESSDAPTPDTETPGSPKGKAPQSDDDNAGEEDKDEETPRASLTAESPAE
ncbi:Putative Actin-interacting protein (Bud6/Aip3) [Aspergillus calidoustus]|uniref:Putative Actin-interacting protein (Bud6/Aip3) n=1 Tax=Aspergillus calidoustus TaxID=454130 RepID=A0A0U5GU50_ASPCI|nr:Putative Actin-interacting protein (Bud6/Aip3) [Aspergillus calidoustus]